MLKHFTFFFILLCIAGSSYSQRKCNTALISEISKEQGATQPINILVQYKAGQEQALKNIPGLIVKYTAGNIASVTASRAAVLKLAADPTVIYMEYPQPHFRKMNDSMVVINRISAVKTGMAPLAQAYDGSGVVLGFIDSGIDYHHPDFKDAAGNTRIQYIWDMTISTPTVSPSPFNYGQEWSHTDIDAGNCTHTGTAEFGHGTHVTGIAAGNGRAISHFEGVAPKADIIMVALDFYRPGPTIADAVHYILNKAQALGKPCAINASVGDYYGSHDGTDLQAQLINALVTNIPGRVLVGAAGNGGSVRYHVGYNVSATDTNFTWINNNTNQLDYWLYADTNDIKQVRYSMGVNSPNFNNLGRIPFRGYNAALGTTKYDTIFHNGSRIGVVASSASINSFGVYELYMSVKPDSTSYNWRIETTGTGKFDAWNFDFVTTGLPTMLQYPRIIYYKAADTLQTLVSSFQCSDEIITVGNYVNRNQYTDVSGTLRHTGETTGQIAASSSTGPTRDHRVKPDVAASGATSISCIVLSLAPNLVANAPNVVAQGGYHVVDGGTSSSCPVVAGWAALYLQANPNATNRQIRQAIINCTYTDTYTGASLPNYRWGYGKLDGFRAFTCMNTADVQNLGTGAGDMMVFPNPASQLLNITFSNTASRNIRLYDLLGNVLLTSHAPDTETSLYIGGLSAGVYILEVSSGNQVANRKVIIQ